MNFTYSKAEKLKSKTTIDLLFSKGKSVSKYPLRLVYWEGDFGEEFPIKMGVSVSKKHFIKLVKYTNQMTFILDSDEAGKRAAEKIYEKFVNHGIKLRFLNIPNGYKDIDEYFFKHSNNKETFEKDFTQFIPGV